MACGNQHHLAVNLLAECLCNLGQKDGARFGIPDILLRFVQNQDGARNLTILAGPRKYPFEHGQEFVGCNVGRALGELCLDHLSGRCFVRGEVGIAGEESLRDQGADIEITRVPFPTPCQNPLRLL